MLATPNAKNIAIPIPKIQDPALVAPVQKPRPVIPKALKPIPKPDVTLNPEPEIVHQQTEAPIIERERSVSAETATSEDIPLATLTEAEIGTAQTPVISAQDYRLKNYSLLIRERINKVKRYPMMARKAGKQGSVVVEFNLNRRGELLGSQVVNSCGTKALDNAALKALTRASPFDQLPDNLKSPHTFKVRINFFLAG